MNRPDVISSRPDQGMRRMSLCTSLLSFLLCVSASTAGAQTMYKCVQAGKTVYQAEPCPDAATQGTLKIQPAPAAGARGAAGPAADVDGAIEVMAGYKACAEAVGEWDPTHRDAYQQWRARNAAMVARVEKDKDVQARYIERLRANRGGTARTCVKVLDVIKPDRPGPRPATR